MINQEINHTESSNFVQSLNTVNIIFNAFSRRKGQRSRTSGLKFPKSFGMTHAISDEQLVSHVLKHGANGVSTNYKCSADGPPFGHSRHGLKR